MGDLDSFFAKKDKKKLKGRKFDNLDDIAKRLEETEKKLEKELIRAEPPKKPLSEVLNTDSEETKQKTAPVIKEEEEWKDFTDDTQKDLTDLKISKLNIENDDDAGGYGSGEDGDSANGANNASEGVWNKNIDKIEEEVKKEEPKAKPVPVQNRDDLKSSYVPPHLRNQTASPVPRVSRGKPKTAPDISNANAFPTLSMAQTANPAGQWGRKKNDDRGYESVKHGSTKFYSVNDCGPAKLSTTNRFDALNDS